MGPCKLPNMLRRPPLAMFNLFRSPLHSTTGASMSHVVRGNSDLHSEGFSFLRHASTLRTLVLVVPLLAEQPRPLERLRTLALLLVHPVPEALARRGAALRGRSTHDEVQASVIWMFCVVWMPAFEVL